MPILATPVLAENVFRVAGFFAAVVLAVVFAAGAWVLYSRDGVEEVPCDALEENTQGIQAEGIQEEEQSESDFMLFDVGSTNNQTLFCLSRIRNNR